jgi:putative ABC transport system permease protein
MNIGQAIFEALESLNSNKMRSGLTILGIVIGVAAVIAMLAIGQGAQDTITGSISGIGTNLLFVFRNNNEDNRNPQPLTMGDAQAIGDPFQAPSVQAVAPILSGNAQLTFDAEKLSTSLNGVTPDYQAVRNWALLEGEFITQDHILGQASVAVLGSEVAKKLFGQDYGITGQTIRIEGQPFRVIGVLESKGGGSFGSEDSVILIPFSTAQQRLIRRNRDRVDVIYIQATSSDSVKQATQEITDILRVRHRIMFGADDFQVFSQADFVQTAATILGVFTIFLGGIAGISLLVGGIGIMNIMLVSVTERTREIGLRKAIGARRRDILIQFLTESSLLSLLGGLIGIAFGYLIAYTVGLIATANNTPFTPSVRLDAVLLATLFSTAVGLFFGIYPANRAASLVPVEALRYE